MEINKDNVIKVINEVRKSLSASYWVKEAIEKLLARDPVDAWKDAILLEKIMNARVKRVLGDWEKEGKTRDNQTGI